MIIIDAILNLAKDFIAKLHRFWNGLIGWIKKAVSKIKEVLGIAVQGTRTFLEKTAEGLKNKSKYYNENKLTGEWEETVFTKVISPDELPDDIRRKIQGAAMNAEVSTTDELSLQISQ